MSRYSQKAMPSAKDDVLLHALELPVEDRADVARELIASLDGVADPDVETAWADEVERRLKEVDAGTAVVEDWDVVHDRIVARLRTLRT
jgi:putative addiction module component (TIGR02574 family)